MHYHLIKSDKQDNGLYGMSLSVGSLKDVLFMKDPEDEIKLSAIIMAICEVHGNNNSNIHIEGLQTLGFIKINIYNSKLWQKDSHIFINLDDYGLLGDKVYWVKSDDDKKMFNRLVKIKKLKGTFNI